MSSNYNKGFRSVYKLTAHIVFVTKYRKKAIDLTILNRLHTIFEETLNKWDCQLVQFDGEVDHVHLLVEFKPDIQLSKLIANLKTVSSRLIRKEYPEVSQQYFNCSLMLMTPGLTARDCPNNQLCGTISRLTEEEQVELARTIEIQSYFNSITNQIHHVQSVLASERFRINAEEAAIIMLKQRGAMPPIEDFCIQESIETLTEAIDSLSAAR
ncbi:MAG: IS200/IS605 family transposase [Prochloraceae cyanobacterium]